MIYLKACFNYFILLFILLVPVAAISQQVADTIHLKSVEIIGTPDPATIKIEKKSIEQLPVSDAGMLLREVPGISGVKKGGSVSDPVIRGFRFSQLSVMADDGLKVEGGCPNRMDPVTSHIESDDIESIDVIKGPYALRYGPVLGGTVRLNTFKPVPYDHFQIHAKFRTSLSSNPLGINQYALLRGGGKKFYFGISGSYKDFGDYHDGDGNKVSSSFRKYNFSVAAGYRPFPGHELILTMHQNFGRDVKFPALPMDEIKDNTNLLSADYHILFNRRVLRKLDFKIYNSDVYHEMDNSFRPAYSQVVAPYSGLMQAVAKVDALNTGGRCELNFVSGKHEINTGIDLENVAKDGGRVMTMIMTMSSIETTSVKTTNLWKEARLLNSGLFGEYSLYLGKYKARFAARLDYNQADSQDTLVLKKDGVSYFGETNSSFINFSANAGIIRVLGKNQLLSFHAGRSMRSPDLTERFIKFLVVGYDNYDYLGNPELRPEINYQADIIYNLSYLGTGKLTLNGFVSMVEDYISGVILPSSVATPKSMGALGVKQFMNVGRAYFTGFEATCLSPEYKGLTADISAAFTYGIQAKSSRNIFEDGQAVGTQDINDDAVQEIPPFEARLNVNYSFLKDRMQAGIGTRFVASQKHVSLSYYENETPGFVLMNLMMKYSINKTVSVSAGVQNLFNKNYYEHLNRRIVGSTEKLYEAGRNFYLNLLVDL
jgi:iron complex outermembrane receptor protein